jgi:nickel transport protein
MTSFRLTCCLCCCLLLICGSVGFAEPSENIAPVTVTQLQQDNVFLQRQVNRLEAQVTAMRDEMNGSDASQIFAGIGYIVGIFGVAAWVAARKKNGQGN